MRPRRARGLSHQSAPVCGDRCRIGRSAPGPSLCGSAHSARSFRCCVELDRARSETRFRARSAIAPRGTQAFDATRAGPRSTSFTQTDRRLGGGLRTNLEGRTRISWQIRARSSESTSGTTNSVVAVMEGGQPTVIRERGGRSHDPLGGRDSPTRASAWSGRSRSGRPSRTRRERSTRSSASWDAASSEVPEEISLVPYEVVRRQGRHGRREASSGEDLHPARRSRRWCCRS